MNWVPKRLGVIWVQNQSRYSGLRKTAESSDVPRMSKTLLNCRQASEVRVLLRSPRKGGSGLTKVTHTRGTLF